MVQPKLLIATGLLALAGCPSSTQLADDIAGTGGSFPVLEQPVQDAGIEVALVAAQPSYQAETGSRAAGVMLARMTVSEATSLQPLNSTWQLDMQGILQVARNNQLHKESLLEALSKMSPHISTLKPATDPRHTWISSLPSRGIEPPDYWVECVGWETVRGRKRSVPTGCDGVWSLGTASWATLRAYAITLVQQGVAPASVQGKPLTWGGLMDIASFLRERPNMCWLESGPTVNYFFGLRNDPANHCKQLPEEIIRSSRVLSAKLVAKHFSDQRK